MCKGTSNKLNGQVKTIQNDFINVFFPNIYGKTCIFAAEIQIIDDYEKTIIIAHASAVCGYGADAATMSAGG